MGHFSKYRMGLGIVALALAILGTVIAISVPSFANSKKCSGRQGLITTNLGI